MASALQIPVVWQTALLLAASNVFMTFAWYAHLKNLIAPPLVDRCAGVVGHRPV